MQTTKLLASVCKELDKLNRNFFWGGNEKKNKIHLCLWNLACRPKSKGGLVCWPRLGGGFIIKIVDCGPKFMRLSICKRIGNGDQVKFWQDKWLNDEPMLKHHGNASVSDLNCHVSHFFEGGKILSNEQRIWKWLNKKVFGEEEDLEWVKDSSTVHTPINTTQIFLAWDPPDTGQFKLNVDGSCQCASGVIGVGGVIRDDKPRRALKKKKKKRLKLSIPYPFGLSLILDFMIHDP
ncbi:hypothetical protein Prudu_006301 [Prunus dulcis]|uniref:Uncharacterized protein n=1 Tax=Prunus dulcis TaxID=3755 RepID=A0A4Y1QZH4_PRUDU|nr:hypothetical protein Prudu_006301 [Prunus dulcis]